MGVYTELTQRWDMKSPALIDPVEGALSYEELDCRVRKVATWLEGIGLTQGQVVCIQAAKSVQLLEVILGCLAQGLVILPLNESYSAEQCAFYISDTQATVFIAAQAVDVEHSCCNYDVQVAFSQMECCEPMEALPHIDGDELAMLLYTSGTTGIPKGAMISHHNMMATIKGLHELWQWSEKDILLHVLPIFHIHGLAVAQLGALYAGAQSVWMHRFDAESVGGLIQKYQVTVFMAVPTIYYRILDCLSDSDLSSMRLFTSGSAPLPVRIHEQFEARFGFRILERYGMTEVGIVLSNPCVGERRIGTVGFPVGQTRIRIVDLGTGRDCDIDEVGEIWISGPSVISGYWQRPEASAESIQDGWLKSGDLGKRDGNGYISIVGRSKDLIITGGFNVYPRDIERIFLECDCVTDIAVVGLPDDEWGEMVVGVVVSDNIDHAALHEQSMRLASYQRPRAWALVAEFPRNAMGKVQKARIREQLQKNPDGLFRLKN